MTKHLTLLLFIGLAWGQSEPDTLILRNGSKYSGKFFGITFLGIKFGTPDKNIVKPTVKSIQKLSVNAYTIINNGQWVVPKEFVENSSGNINQQSLDNYLIIQEKYQMEYENYQQDYQQGVTAAKKDWADSRRFYGILPRSKVSLFIKEKNTMLVTDSQAPVPGFRDGYRKEMAKLKFKQNIKLASPCCLYFSYIIFKAGGLPWPILH